MKDPEELRQADRRAEYAALRNELVGILQRNEQIAAVSFPLAGAVFAFAYLNKNAEAYLAVIFVLGITLGLSAFAGNSMIRLGSYISAVFETKDSGFQWETLAAKRRYTTKALIRPDYLYLILAYWVISIGCLLLAIFSRDDRKISNGEFYLPLIVALVVLAGATYFTYRFTSEKYYNDLIKMWNDETKALAEERAKERVLHSSSDDPASAAPALAENGLGEQ